MKTMRRGILVTAIAAIVTSQFLAGAALRYVIGVGVWQTGGRVSTLEMVGLNPQPEPPSRPVAVYTSGTKVVSIRFTCTRIVRDTFSGTGQGNDGRWYLVTIVNAQSSSRGGDRVGVASLLVPPNPCTGTPTSSLLAGEFFLR